MAFDLDAYRAQADRTSRYRGQFYYGGPITAPGWARVEAGLLGLSGEAGELAELVKKAVHHGHALEPAAGEKELGDFLWYVSDLITSLAIQVDPNQPSFEQIQKNDADLAAAGFPQMAPVPPLAVGHPSETSVEFTRMFGLVATLIGQLTMFLYGCSHNQHQNSPRGSVPILTLLFSAWHRLVALFHLDAELVALANVAKLKRRYPEGFSVAASVNRKD